MEQKKKSVLFLPFLQIPSGHHQVAKALIDGICELSPHIECEKMDILAYSYGGIEKLISQIYIKWIHVFPQIYNGVYRNAVYKKRHEKRYRLYELLFLYFMKKLVNDRKPDLIVCTHSLPAYMLNFLKEKGSLEVPVVNVYTDYFVHQFWGVKNIDYHFAPNIQVKSFLLERGVKEERIYVTGIPIHRKVKKHKQQPQRTPNKEDYNILVSGGNLGVGALSHLIEEIKDHNAPQKIQFYVLCGKNNKLFQRLNSLQREHIIPLPYIEHMDKMNSLYECSDAIITKPGGVTISEALAKRVPIFIYHALPGQEKINLHELKELGLVFPLEGEKICEHILTVLNEEEKLKQYQSKVNEYHKHIHPEKPAQLLAKFVLEN